MALNIKSPEVEELVAKVAAMTGESKTEAVRRALAERRERLSLHSTRRERGSAFMRYLAEEIWPKVPPDQLGRRISREEEDEILGYGPQTDIEIA
ncbi:MAG TPA: type II toxin-antitoxin system VapB family antitoxin [Thermoanaerobaculia bacterium]|nr:type II toxin-antitoxin system VapB family antitoxin [Thermoanaerobaculia bacterium]